MFKSISFLQKQRTLTGNKRKAVTKHRGAKRRQNLSSSSWAQPTPAPSRLGTLGFWFCGFGFFIVVVVVFCLVPTELLWGCHQRPSIALFAIEWFPVFFVPLQTAAPKMSLLSFKLCLGSPKTNLLSRRHPSMALIGCKVQGTWCVPRQELSSTESIL